MVSAWFPCIFQRNNFSPTKGVGSGIRGKDRTRSICKNTAKITCNPNLPELDDAWATDSGLNSQSRRLNFLNASIGATNKYQRYNQELQNKKISGQNWTAKLASSNNFEHRILTESKPKSKGRKPKRQGGIWDPNVLYHEQLHTAKHQGERYWPAFRTIHNTRSDLKVLEPGFYYRIEVDFKKSVPEPFLLNIDVSSKSVLLDDILSSVLSHDSEPRLVLDLKDDKDAHSFAGRGRPRDMMAWAKDPLSSWGDAVIDKRGYLLMPQFKDNNLGAYRKFDILETVYICPEFLRREYGNRACFNKCT